METVLVHKIIDLPRILGIGLSKVKQEIASGKLRSIKSGRRRLVTHAALLAWIADREREAEITL
jgi:excisionase family DNA binding protein